MARALTSTDEPSAPPEVTGVTQPADASAAGLSKDRTVTPPPASPKTLLPKIPVLDDFGQHIEHFKGKLPFTISAGAFHWWHINIGGPLPTGYGLPDMDGTHSYYIYLDKEEPVEWGDISKVGTHLEMRFRDGTAALRPFFHDPHFWLWEAYGFFDTPLGRLKIGSIYKQFGLFWDDSFWGHVQYLDGLKLDSDYGVSLETTPEFEGDFKLDRYLQFYFARNRVSGALLGADPESFAGSREYATFVGRVVPTWKLAEEETLAVGLSTLAGGLDNRSALRMLGTGEVFASPGDQIVAGWAADATWTAGQWKLFGEVSQVFGVVSPRYYASGGSSDRFTDALAGIHYIQGPITYRFVYSTGFADNPCSWQSMFVPGVTIRLTKNLTLWCEYVFWETRGGQPTRSIVNDNGCQLVAQWHF